MVVAKRPMAASAVLSMDGRTLADSGRSEGHIFRKRINATPAMAAAINASIGESSVGIGTLGVGPPGPPGPPEVIVGVGLADPPGGVAVRVGV